MAFLTKEKKEDLRRLGWEMRFVVAEDLRILDIKQLILSAEGYEKNSIKDLFTNIIEERIEKNKVAAQVAEWERRKAEINFELHKLKLQLEVQKSGVSHEKAHLREYRSKSYTPKRISLDDRFNPAGSTSFFNRNDKLKTDDKSERPPASCYDCDKLGVTKLRCPNCTPIANRNSANFGNIIWHSCFSTPNQISVLKLAVNGIGGTAYADIGASHSIAGKTLYRLLQ
ncbi:hypothetical protein TNIN_33791 [Trichonephila inaurata madagascariensis]|uniref:Uncharacterized protein n=1 Tax=Trichonephila inaurata madagascariensis TaxID=2747483 RepID=A0A8X7C2K3_9ARAC|nr:hypothetical protein TNIN_33791 [Trichonephila inaurata madagascariensis]